MHFNICMIVCDAVNIIDYMYETIYRCTQSSVYETIHKTI